MPWKESRVVKTRTEFALQALSGTVPFLELCKQYGISRKTGYKWKERFIKDGHHGMSDQSRRPTSSPAKASEEAVCQIVKLKLPYWSWGPRKIRTLFARSFPALELPSESTFKRVLDKAGLVVHRRHRSPSEAGRISNRIVPERPNRVWTVDFLLQGLLKYQISNLKFRQAGRLSHAYGTKLIDHEVNGLSECCNVHRS